MREFHYIHENKSRNPSSTSLVWLEEKKKKVKKSSIPNLFDGYFMTHSFKKKKYIPRDEEFPGSSE